MKADVVDQYTRTRRDAVMGVETWLGAAMSDGRAIIHGIDFSRRRALLGVLHGGACRAFHDGAYRDDQRAAYATDGERLARLSRTTLELWSKLDATPRTLAVKPPKQEGEVVCASLVAGEDAAWLILSDSFMVVEGRYVGQLTWSGKRARVGTLKQPYPWQPYSHAFQSLQGVAPSAGGAWLCARGGTTAALSHVGGKARPVRVRAKPRDLTVLEISGKNLLVVSRERKRGIFVDTAGKEIDGFAFGAKLLGRVKTMSNISAVALCGRDLWFSAYDGLIVHARLDGDAPRLGGPRDAPIAVASTPPGAFGPLALPASAVDALAFERVRGWDLNETPAYGKPAPIAAILVDEDTIAFYNERLRKKFDFLLQYTRAISWTAAPAAARVPRDVVLLQIRTESGLTQALCRETLAKTMRDVLAARRARRRRRR